MAGLEIRTRDPWINSNVDGRTDRGNNNIPEFSLESAGIITVQETPNINHA